MGILISNRAGPGPQRRARVGNTVVEYRELVQVLIDLEKRGQEPGLVEMSEEESEKEVLERVGR